jgi:hypothetical protein
MPVNLGLIPNSTAMSIAVMAKSSRVLAEYSLFSPVLKPAGHNLTGIRARSNSKLPLNNRDTSTLIAIAIERRIESKRQTILVRHSAR